jgi:hypothetical protein
MGFRTLCYLSSLSDCVFIPMRTFTALLLFVACFLSAATALDVVYPAQAVVVTNATCYDYFMPDTSTCTDCTRRIVRFTLEPHNSDPVQSIAVTEFPGTVPVTVQVVDNTGFAAVTVHQSLAGYMLCSAAPTPRGWSTTISVLQTLLMTPKPTTALTIAQTWTLPDATAAYVDFSGVQAATTGCILAGNVDAVECMRLCTRVDTCTHVVKTATECGLCADATAATKTWTVEVPGQRILVRGKSVHLFIETAIHSAMPYVSAFPGYEKTVSSIFTTSMAMLVLALLFLAGFSDGISVLATYSRVCQLLRLQSTPGPIGDDEPHDAVVIFDGMAAGVSDLPPPPFQQSESPVQNANVGTTFRGGATPGFAQTHDTFNPYSPAGGYDAGDEL